MKHFFCERAAHPNEVRNRLGWRNYTVATVPSTPGYARKRKVRRDLHPHVLQQPVRLNCLEALPPTLFCENLASCRHCICKTTVHPGLVGSHLPRLTHPFCLYQTDLLPAQSGQPSNTKFWRRPTRQNPSAGPTPCFTHQGMRNGLTHSATPIMGKFQNMRGKI